MFEKLALIKQKFDEINESLAREDVLSDISRYTALMKELKKLQPIADKYNEYLVAKENAEEAASIIESDEYDAEFKEMAQAQREAAREDIERIELEAKVLLLPQDENDEKNVIVEIRGGAGGDEAALFAASLYRMYSMYAESRRWKCELLNANETELGGFKEVTFGISGSMAYSRMKYESGVHRVQRVPETETQGRIHTSTVTVAVLPEAEEVELDINPKDLQIDTYRSGGAGGQHVNKTESAIRITHLPTGLVVECQDERSQYKNKDRAMKILRSRLLEMMQREQNEAVAASRKSMVGSGDRSERIRTYNFPQGRVTDHRIGLTIYRLEAFLNGDLDEVIDALITADQAEKMRDNS